jgi:hypothetical protein
MVLASHKGQRNFAAICFDQLFVNLRFQVLCQLRPTFFLASHWKEYLAREKAAPVIVGIEHPHGDMVGTAGDNLAFFRVIVIKAKHFDLIKCFALVALSNSAQLSIGLADKPKALVARTLFLKVLCL